ncbi:hypothetical protein AB0N65_14165 [Paenarthrobacter sp. NPDC089322]|uniref:hypothetical protein n=1 Tax=Paenarthrobacter sp. NPDC089322 TaxID=3155065 RepID=UPI003438BA56
MSGNRPYRRAGAVIAAGTAIWFAGISPVQRVYITADAAARLRMLQAGKRGWVVGQHLAAAGTVAVPVGFAAFARALPHGKAKGWAIATAGALLTGAPLFVASLANRASNLEKFAYRRGSNWPFLAYSGFHVLALAALGGSLLASPAKRWIGVTAAASAPVYGAILVAKKDIPPFVFYLIEGIAGAYLMVWEEPPASAEPGRN